MEFLVIALFGVVLGVWSWATETRGRVALALLGCEIAIVAVSYVGPWSRPLAPYIAPFGTLCLIVLAPIVPLYAGAAVFRRKDTFAAWFAFAVGAVFAGFFFAGALWPVVQLRA